LDRRGPKPRTEDWETLDWKRYQRNVFRLQRRIYRAARQGDWRRVHKLQRLLLRSWSARCLAVRRVSQENRGKRTAGVDGVKNLTPRQRLNLVKKLANLKEWHAAPIEARPAMAGAGEMAAEATGRTMWELWTAVDDRGRDGGPPSGRGPAE
jgi:hypothetical protein